MLLEGILFSCLTLVILVFFYRQAITEFRINQTDALTKVPALLQEKCPIVVQPFPIPTDLWTHRDIQSRKTLGQIVIPDTQMTLGATVQPPTEPRYFPGWSREFATQVATQSGLPVWVDQTIPPIFQGQSLLGKLYSQRTDVYLGPRGLTKTYGFATVLFVMDGVGQATILNEQANPYLPKNSRGKRLSQMTREDAPLIHQIQCMDIILRPGSALILPPHWRYCMEEQEGIQPISWVSVTMHHPISRGMEHVSVKRQLD